MELNITNPHCFIYQTEELLIEMLGGIRIDTLDRMRVTMKVTVVISIFIFLPLEMGNKITRDLLPVISSGSRVTEFIKESFDVIDSDDTDPYFIYRRNRKLKTGQHISFCGLDVVDCWAYLKSKNSYFLYLRLHYIPGLNKHLTSFLGEPESGFSVSVNDDESPMSYIWKYNNSKVFWIQYLSPPGSSSNRDVLVLVGNMEIKEVIGMTM